MATYCQVCPRLKADLNFFRSVAKSQNDYLGCFSYFQSCILSPISSLNQGSHYLGDTSVAENKGQTCWVNIKAPSSTLNRCAYTVFLAAVWKLFAIASFPGCFCNFPEQPTALNCLISTRKQARPCLACSTGQSQPGSSFSGQM